MRQHAGERRTQESEEQRFVLNLLLCTWGIKINTLRELRLRDMRQHAGERRTQESEEQDRRRHHQLRGEKSLKREQPRGIGNQEHGPSEIGQTFRPKDVSRWCYKGDG